MKLNSRPKLKEHIIFREEDFGGMLYNKKLDKVLQINKIGYFILLNLDGKTSIKDIIEELHKKYSDMDKDKIKKDVLDFLGKLKEMSVISV